MFFSEYLMDDHLNHNTIFILVFLVNSVIMNEQRISSKYQINNNITNKLAHMYRS